MKNDKSNHHNKNKNKHTINLFYSNQMHSNSKQDEKTIKKYNRLCTYHSMVPTNALTFTIKILSI